MDNRNFNRKDGGYGRGGIVNFLDKQGIYIIMLVCLALIGITAYFALGSGGSDEQAEQPSPSTAPAGAQNDTTLEEEIKKLQATPTPTPKATTTPSPTSTPVAATPENLAVESSSTYKAPVAKAEKTPEPTPEPAAKALMPVEGGIIRPYSPEEPVFYSTLNEWMVHLGVDIEAPDDTDVRCSLDGTVESVENRAETGYTIVVDHGEGVKTLYGNLASPDGVQVGQQVNRGDAIGKVGRSATSTISDPAHVHFEYSKDGIRENPEEICVWNDNQ